VVTALSLGEVAELTEIRVALETMATRIAVPRTGEEGLRGAEEVLARAEAAPDLETHWSELDREFHCALYAAADRPQLMIMLTKLRSKFERYLGATDLLATDHTQREQREHRELLELYRKGDVDRSVDLVERHIRYAGESAAAAISELRGKEPT
jgi:DNA-binding GntR family transcriptional regulator